MHSSRIRTALLLPVSPSMHCSGGYTCPVGVPAQGVYLPRGVYLSRGCTCLGGCVPAQEEGTCPGGGGWCGLPEQGVHSCPGGGYTCPGGRYTCPGGGVPANRGAPARGAVPALGVCTWGYLPRYSLPRPPVNRMTDRCKNITLSQTSFAGGNKFSKKVTSDRDWTCDPWTLMYLLLQSHVFYFR